MCRADLKLKTRVLAGKCYSADLSEIAYNSRYSGNLFNGPKGKKINQID